MYKNSRTQTKHIFFFCRCAKLFFLAWRTGSLFMFNSLDAICNPVISQHADKQKILHTRKHLSSFHRGKGLILNISSGTASIPFPMYTLYSASKVPLSDTHRRLLMSFAILQVFCILAGVRREIFSRPSS